jgi:Ca2+-binding EF-hand superfamily protein
VTRFQIIGCVCAALASAAAAQSPPKPIARADYAKVLDNRFNAMDLNHDGKVTRDEMEALRQRELQQGRVKIEGDLRNAFTRLDTNKDGKLSLQEFLASVPTVKTAETADQIMQRLDTNHDGKVTADEFRAPELAKFNRVDANHDGIVTPQEQQAARGK